MREAVIISFAHARYDLPVQHEIDIFSGRISIVNPGSFANEFEPIDFVSRDIHTFLRNETIARVLYLCKGVETFGSGIRKIYSLCNTAGVEIKYENTDTDFKMEFSRIDQNKSPLSGQENGRINDHISEPGPGRVKLSTGLSRDDQCEIDCKNRKIPAYDYLRAGFIQRKGIDQPHRLQ